MGFWVTWEEEELNPVTGVREWVLKRKYFPLDTKAAGMWLTNRKPHQWQHVRKHEVEVKRRTPEEILTGIHTSC